jgi:hypothetical protein
MARKRARARYRLRRKHELRREAAFVVLASSWKVQAWKSKVFLGSDPVWVRLSCQKLWPVGKPRPRWDYSGYKARAVREYRACYRPIVVEPKPIPGWTCE